MKPTVLIVDDEKLLLRSLEKAISGAGYYVLTALNGKEALSIFEQNLPDLVLLDVRLPDMSGMEVLQKIKSLSARCPVIIMTAYSGVKGAVEAIQLGAYNYIAKPFDVEELKLIIARCLESKKTEDVVNTIRSTKKARYRFDNILTNNVAMKKIMALSKRVAYSAQSTVLILGDSGTGKELFANAIHYNGPRSHNPFVAINCAALSEGVLESELFGHEKGAFTGALKQKKGLFELSDKGTLFLDEIGEISQQTQIKLLRFLEERNFQRVGGTRSIEVDVRIIAATNKDLLTDVRNGRFREDLYYRLNVISIVIPPLRERKDDIPLLVNHFIREYNTVLNKQISGGDEDALKILLAYDWPGNIRELRNVIERSVLLNDGAILKSSGIPLEITGLSGEVGAPVISPHESLPLDGVIKQYVESVLAREKDNKTKAANVMGITRQRLRRILNSDSDD